MRITDKDLPVLHSESLWWVYIPRGNGHHPAYPVYVTVCIPLVEVTVCKVHCGHCTENLQTLSHFVYTKNEQILFVHFHMFFWARLMQHRKLQATLLSQFLARAQHISSGRTRTQLRCGCVQPVWMPYQSVTMDLADSHGHLSIWACRDGRTLMRHRPLVQGMIWGTCMRESMIFGTKYISKSISTTFPLHLRWRLTFVQWRIKCGIWWVGAKTVHEKLRNCLHSSILPSDAITVHMYSSYKGYKCPETTTKPIKNKNVQFLHSL